MDDFFLGLGGVFLVIGAGMIYLPAAFITAGILFIGIAILIGKQNAVTAKPVSEQQSAREDR